MPRVRLKGLNIRRNASGAWYVSLRATGEALIKGFSGSRAALDRALESPDFLARYNAARTRDRRPVYPDGSLGHLVDWYKGRRAFSDLAARTRADYARCFLFLEPVFDYNVTEITPADVAEMRDRARAKHYDRFADMVVSAMSALFREAVEYGRLPQNPALGIRRVYRPGKEANRPWTAVEWDGAFAIAPVHLRPALAIARWAGLRGQDIAALTWADYASDPEIGRALVFTPKKNGEKVGTLVVGARAELRSVLDPLSRGTLPTAPICRNSRGKRFPSENALRKAWQDFKSSEPFRQALPHSADLTLHGLRVTFASELRDKGFSDRDIADMLGDLTDSMGRRYARGARMKKTSERVSRAFGNGS